VIGHRAPPAGSRGVVARNIGKTACRSRCEALEGRMKRPAHRLQLPVARSRPARRVPRPGLRHVRLHCTTVARTLHTRARADRCFGRRCTRTPRSLESPQL